MDWRGFERFESLVIAAVAAAAFFVLADGSLLRFLLLILLPDVAMAGYLRGPRVGAVVYNAAHVYAGPAVLLVYGVMAGPVLVQQVALVWTVHIAADRALGFGLKQPTGFRETHLGDL